VRFRLYLTCFAATKLRPAAEKLLVTLFVPRLTFYPLPKSITLFLDLPEVFVGFGFIIVVPT